MTIDAASAVPPTASVFAGPTPAAAPKQELDGEAFLALLVAQLRYQDPTSPLDTSEMMAQSTQLATMEQLVTLTETSRENFSLQMRMAAAALVGQQVEYVDAAGETATGVVASVSYAGPVPVVVIGEESVPLDAISTVLGAPRADGSEPDPT